MGLPPGTPHRGLMTLTIDGSAPGFSAFIVNPKHGVNRGSIERAVWNLGGTWIIRRGLGAKRASTDTAKAWRHLPVIDLPDNPAQAQDTLTATLGEHTLIAVDTTDVLSRCRNIRQGWYHLRSLPTWRNTVYMLGNEANGLPNAWLDICEHGLSIPMGRVPGSLNVALAAGIVLQRHLEQSGLALPARSA